MNQNSKTKTKKTRELLYKVRPKHWWYWLSPKFRAAKRVVEYEMSKPKYKKEVHRMMRELLIYGHTFYTDTIDEQDTDS